MARLFSLRLLVCAAPAFMLAPAALGQTAIGGASVVVNDVRGDNAGKRARISLGDRVFANQGVQTATDSMAKFVFLDDTNMTLGPDSRVKLDTFVFDPQGSGRNIAVTAAKGAFRFVSGTSPSQAYKVTTPHAHIGVRGTTYDVRVENGRTLVVLQNGAVNVCMRNSARCSELTEPGQSVAVTDNDISAAAAPADKPWDFASLCAGRTADLCGVTQFAQVAAPVRRAQAAPPQRQAAPPRKAQQPRATPPRQTARAPERRPRPARVVEVEEYYEEPVYIGRPGRFIVGGGIRPPLLDGGRGPRPGWRPPGGGNPPGVRPPGVRPPGVRPPSSTPPVIYSRDRAEQPRSGNSRGSGPNRSARGGSSFR